jgi:hypothetical protein
MNRRNPENPVLKVTLLLTSTFTVMAWTMIAPALPSIQAHFAEVANVAFWVRLVLTLPALFIAASAPIAGYSSIVGQPVSGIVGLGGLYLSGGALLLVIAALLWVTRNQLRSLTG